MSRSWPVPDVLLDRYLAGDLPRKRRRAIEEAMKSSDELRQHMADLMAEREAMLAGEPAAQFARRVMARAGVVPRPSRWALPSWTIPAGAFAAAVVVAVIVMRPDWQDAKPTNETKPEAAPSPQAASAPEAVTSMPPTAHESALDDRERPKRRIAAPRARQPAPVKLAAPKQERSIYRAPEERGVDVASGAVQKKADRASPWHREEAEIATPAPEPVASSAPAASDLRAAGGGGGSGSEAQPSTSVVAESVPSAPAGSASMEDNAAVDAKQKRETKDPSQPVPRVNVVVTGGLSRVHVLTAITSQGAAFWAVWTLEMKQIAPLRLRFEINADGSVRAVRVLSPELASESATRLMAMVAKWKFPVEPKGASTAVVAVWSPSGI